ncbi:MAG: phosphate ABC transporter permease PstA [Pseudomonadota bacterium]
MVDMAELSAMHGSQASAQRMKKRRSAELRLQIYGILAITLAGAALVALLWSVVFKAAGALTETYVTLPVTLSAQELDPDGTGDPAVIGRADYGGFVKDLLKETFPSVTDRKARREMYDVVSAGAGFELRSKLQDDPSLIGEQIDYPFLASDVTDLYLKGSFGRLLPQPHSGNLSVIPSEDGKTAQILTSSNDFAAALSKVKLELIDQARGLRRQAAMQDAGVREFERRAANATSDEVRTENANQAISRATERDRLIALAEELEGRAASAGGTEQLTRTAPTVLVRVDQGWVKLTEINATGGVGRVVLPIEQTDALPADDWKMYLTDLPENARKISDNQIVLIEDLMARGAVETVFNTRFFSAGDSREPELAGLWGAIVGSFWTMLVTFLLAFPIGVGAAIYLEEFAPKNKLTDFIEVNINNLAAVPSIVFGLLGLAVFLGFFGVPRSSPLAGGIVLALMTLPTIIIASRAAIRAVPPSIRDAALGIGASRLQTSFHHVLPLAMPGILTGTIIGMAQALGETAPLIMIGMVAFIVDIPTGVTDSATVLPVQVFRWSDFPERAFEARTAAAICVLLVFLVIMNALAVFLRKRFERRW